MRSLVVILTPRPPSLKGRGCLWARLARQDFAVCPKWFIHQILPSSPDSAAVSLTQRERGGVRASGGYCLLSTCWLRHLDVKEHAAGFVDYRLVAGGFAAGEAL